ncbi:MAG: hypothetical protein K8U57_17560, partial [Planctomycetes bacterium]|nr:hypothetical protein [Planctomycetota bacterium]
MRWPGSRDYNEAVQDPSYSFKDAGLQVAEATVNAHGLPVARSGGFADVYQLRTPTGECWAVKCFTREVTELRRRYQAISDHLSAARESGGLRFMVDFQYLDEEIRVGPERYPAVKMTWVEGKLLHEFVREHADDPVVLTKLTGIWHKLGQNLRAAGMAHGDLQHGNVILVPSAKGVIPQLIDYDGMYVPALEGIPASEIGHANYQHPGRNADRFHLEIDRFPLLLVYTAVRCLATGGRALWNRFDSGDNLLFKESDIKNPAGSALFRELWSSPDPEVRALAGWVILASRMPLRKVPLLDEIIGPDGKQTPALTGLQEAEVRRLMTATQPVASEPKPVPRKSTPVSVTRPGTQPAPVTPAKKTTPAPLPLDADGSKSWLKSLTNAQRLGLLAGGLGALLVISSIIAAVMNSPRSSSGVGTAAIAQGGSADRGQSTMTPSPPKVATKSSEKSPAPSLAKQLVMTGHTDKVATVAISADGKRAISGGYDNAVIVWNLETGKEIQRLTGHKNWVFGVGISADGKRAVSGGYDNAVIVWNLETGKEIRRLTGPTQPVWSVSITPDGKRAISGGQDKALFVWDLETGQELQRLTGHQLTVYAVGISADGKRAVSAGEEKAVFVWNLETGKEIQRLTGHTFAIRAVGISADGKRAVSGAQDSTTSAWNLESGKEIQRFGHESTVRGVAISADGRRVVSSGHDKDVVMWDLETGKEIGRFDRNSDVVSSVAISADGKRVVFGSEDKTVRMWNGPEFVDSAKPVAPTPTPTPIAVQLTANGVSLKTGETKVLDVQIDRNGRTEPLVIHLTGLPAGVTAKPVPIPGATNAVRFALTAAESAPACNVIVRLQARSNGEEINDPLDIAVQVEEAPPVPTVPGQPIILAGHTDTIHTLGISGDGKRAISGGKDMTVRIWNPETRKELHRLTDHKSAIHRVAISADGTRAVSCDEGGFGVVWDAVVGKQLFQIKDVGHIRSVAISADGKRVVFGTTLFGPPVEYLVRIWDLENARELHRLGGHTQSVEHVAITPDGKRAVSSDSGEDRIVRVWDTDKGREISRFTKHPDPVAQVGISADGKRAISRGQYG